MWGQKAKLGDGLSNWQRFLFFSSWPLGLTCAAGGIEAGIIWAFVFHNINIDSGVAAIVAAFIGLGGVIWVAQFAALKKDDPFAEFIGEGASVVWREANRLGKLCSLSESKEPATYPTLLRHQVISVLNFVNSLDKKTPQLNVRSYRAHVEIQALQNVFKLVMITLETEANELKQRPTRNVVNIAKKKLTNCATKLAQNCENVCAAVGHDARMSSVDAVEDVIEDIRQRSKVR